MLEYHEILRILLANKPHQDPASHFVEVLGGPRDGLTLPLAEDRTLPLAGTQDGQVELDMDGTIICSTDLSEFQVVNRCGWVKARQLEQGDVVLFKDSPVLHRAHKPLAGQATGQEPQPQREMEMDLSADAHDTPRAAQGETDQ